MSAPKSKAALARSLATLLLDARDLRDEARRLKDASAESEDHSLWFVWQAAIERSEAWLGSNGYCVEHGDPESCCLGCDEARHAADEKAAAQAEDLR